MLTRRKTAKKRNPCLPCNPSTRATRFARMKRNPGDPNFALIRIKTLIDKTDIWEDDAYDLSIVLKQIREIVEEILN